MNSKIYAPLQVIEIFHIEFLRWFSRKVKADFFCLKGGVNLRLFFKSARYSEDIDIDLQKVGVDKIKDVVMEILSARRFLDSLKSFGIERIVPPNIIKAKQTETTQRFKIHLLTSSGEDLFTKVECSRRGLKGIVVVEPVSAQILRSYKMAPLIVPHYDGGSAIAQKIHALAHRTVLQARDIFDLFILSSQHDKAMAGRSGEISKAVLKTAYGNIFLIEFTQFRDTVVAYLGEDDQRVYSTREVWDEIKLKTAHFIEELKNEQT